MNNVAVALALLLLFSQPSYPDGIFNGGSGGGGGGSGTVTSIATGCQATGGTIQPLAGNHKPPYFISIPTSCVACAASTN